MLFSLGSKNIIIIIIIDLIDSVNLIPNCTLITPAFIVLIVVLWVILYAKY
jgi:hypothetical protein